MSEQIPNYLPFALFVAVLVWGAILQSRCRFEQPSHPLWPFAVRPGLALELAGSLEVVDGVLGSSLTPEGARNRASAKRLQKLDFVLIPIYTMAFAAIALKLGTWRQALPATILALAAALSDYLEDWRILGMLAGSARPAKPFGQAKWSFYFLTIVAEGWLLFPVDIPAGARSLGAGTLAVLLILNGLTGASLSIRGHFNGVLSSTMLSGLLLAPLSLVPMIEAAPFSWRQVFLYADLLRVPLLLAAILIALPFLAFFTGARSLLRGLFDLTPGGVFVVTLASCAAAHTATLTATLVLAHAAERLGAAPVADRVGDPGRLITSLAIALPIVISAVAFSVKERRRGLASTSTAIAGYGVVIGVVLLLDRSRLIAASGLPALAAWAQATGLFAGYVARTGQEFSIYADHLRAVASMGAVILLYAVLGYYGYRRLGKAGTVPALTSALMLMTMLTWLLAGTAFFFDQWRVPLLFIVVLAGTLTAQSVRSDHFYRLRPAVSYTPAPDPVATISAGSQERLIVVAANGGGIQAGAWAAQVLAGLDEDSPGGEFRRALRMISSVSGGSVGSAFFVHWLADPTKSAPPAEAASASSLDEVAWGLGWTDFLRALLPWLFGGSIGRGRALERAWCFNAAAEPVDLKQLDRSLGDLNSAVAEGTIPAIVMNATIAETGERLLLATTQISGGEVSGRARVNAADLHRINGVQRDIGIATAARLSASFPFVTPASRSNGPGPQPHVVDGGYYDNYGLATLVEWLDQALAGAQKVRSVLVIQVLGAPLDRDASLRRYSKSRGWFYQALAPLTTLAAVRSAGQLAHNDIELQLLQQKWLQAGIPVHTVKFEFSNPDAPLSWHLTPTEIGNIRLTWQNDMGRCRDIVRRFLAEQDDLQCGCPKCTARIASAHAN